MDIDVIWCIVGIDPNIATDEPGKQETIDDSLARPFASTVILHFFTPVLLMLLLPMTKECNNIAQDSKRTQNDEINWDLWLNGAVVLVLHT